MGIASLASDSMPTSTFTPQEPLVELLRVSLAQDAVLVMASPQVRIFPDLSVNVAPSFTFVRLGLGSQSQF